MGTAEITVYWADWCLDCRRAKKFLGEQRIPSMSMMCAICSRPASRRFLPPRL